MRWRVLFALWAAIAVPAGGWLHAMAPQDLQIWRGGQKETVDARVDNGRLYYSVSDLLDAFHLESAENRNQLRIKTKRGEAVLIEGRPLVRLGGQYLLLASGTLKGRGGEWFVSADFVDKVLPNILEEKFSRRRDGSLQIESLGENGVRVETTSFPDHVSVTFHSEQDVPIELKDLREYIEVSFGGFLVKPEFIENPPSTTVVSSIEFDPQEAYGSFRIFKGARYVSYRSYRTVNPVRLVVDLYGQDLSAEAGSGPSTGEVVPSPDRGGDRPAPPSTAGTESEPEDLRPAGAEVIVIDPGHGGEDYGVDAYSDVLEKVIALNIGRQVEQQLIQAGYSTRLTRFRDVSLTPEQRSSIANFYRARVFVSLHSGGAPAPEMRGPVVYVYGPAPSEAVAPDGALALVPWNAGQDPFIAQSQRLAGLLQSELNGLFGVENHVVQSKLAVLAPVQAPAILIETGFLTNVEDQTKLADRDFQLQLANGIARAIQSFLSN